MTDIPLWIAVALLAIAVLALWGVQHGLRAQARSMAEASRRSVAELGEAFAKALEPARVKLVERNHELAEVVGAMSEEARLRWQEQQDVKVNAPVRYRDGDECRRCGVRVTWARQSRTRSGTIDFLRPYGPIVVCLSCNMAGRSAYGITRLRPAPLNPVYGLATRDFLTTHGYSLPGGGEEGTTPAGGRKPADPPAGEQSQGVTAEGLRAARRRNLDAAAERTAAAASSIGIHPEGGAR